MARSKTSPDQFSKGDKVVARNEMRDVPEGTQGRVIMVSGLTWIRYWVRFENDVSLGTIPRAALATPDEWRRHLAGEDVFDEAEPDEGTDASSEAGGDAGAGGGVTTPSGTLIPQLLIDRAKAARERLAA